MMIKWKIHIKICCKKKTDELSERMRAISSLETKIYDYSKQINDKQKEIENLMENNNTLQ